MKKLSFLLFILITVLVSGFGELLFATNLNEIRIAEAKKLENSSTDSRDELIRLLQSDLLAPNDEKKMKIAQIYLSSGEFEKAERYLKKIRSNSAYIKYAEAALEENNLKVADIYLAKINNAEARNELNTFKRFIQGEFGVVRNLPITPKTEALRLLQALNNRNFNEIPETTLGAAIRTATSGQEGSTALLTAGQIVLNRSQIKMAEYIAQELLTAQPNLKEAHIFKSEVMLAQNKPQEALESLEQAMAIDPADLDVYEKALNIAVVLSDSGKADLFRQRLDYMKKIIK